MSATRSKTIPACPICGSPAQPETKPFCSSRCADIDLGRWLGEHYVIPGPEDEEAPPPTAERDDERSPR